MIERLREVLRDFLGITTIQSDLDDLKRRFDRFESELESLGGYRKMSKDELLEVKGKIETLHKLIDCMISKDTNREIEERAKAIKRRLKNNLTRVEKATQEHK